MNFCEQCGSRLTPAAKFCSRCGNRLPFEAPVEEPGAVLDRLRPVEDPMGARPPEKLVAFHAPGEPEPLHIRALEEWTTTAEDTL